MNDKENYEEYFSWCYCNHIYFYAFTKNCETGFCKIVKWVKGEKFVGNKIFKVTEVENKIREIYREVYLKNNNNIIELKKTA